MLFFGSVLTRCFDFVVHVCHLLNDGFCLEMTSQDRDFRSAKVFEMTSEDSSSFEQGILHMFIMACHGK